MKHFEQFWDKQAKNYDKQALKRYKQTYEDTIEHTKKYLQKDHRVLDFACGTGLTTLPLSRYVKNICALDISEKMINSALKKSQDQKIKNIDFLATHIFDSHLDNQKYDIIMAFNILYFLDDIDSVMNRIKQLMASDGIFISATDCLGEKKSLTSSMLSFFSRLKIIPRVQLWTTEELMDIFHRNGFDILERENLYFNPPNYFIVAKKISINLS